MEIDPYYDSIYHERNSQIHHKKSYPKSTRYTLVETYKNILANKNNDNLNSIVEEETPIEKQESRKEESIMNDEVKIIYFSFSLVSKIYIDIYLTQIKNRIGKKKKIIKHGGIEFIS